MIVPRHSPPRPAVQRPAEQTATAREPLCVCCARHCLSRHGRARPSQPAPCKLPRSRRSAACLPNRALQRIAWPHFAPPRTDLPLCRTRERMRCEKPFCASPCTAAHGNSVPTTAHPFGCAVCGLACLSHAKPHRSPLYSASLGIAAVVLAVHCKIRKRENAQTSDAIRRFR